MRVGIIGLGRAGAMHLEAWQSLPTVEVAAVADPAPAVRMQATAGGLHAYADPLDMLERESLEAVSICTPPVAHPELAIACLQRGLHVLCEKPLAFDARAARKMLRAAAAARRHLLLATKFRHVPDLIRTRELIAEGTIGDPVAFTIEFSSVVDMTQRWNRCPELGGGGVIIDNGCHAFDIVSFLFGAISRLLATRLKQGQRLEVEDSATILVGASRELIGRIEVSWSLPGTSETYVKVHGTRGSIDIGWRASHLRLAGSSPQVIGRGYDKTDAHRRMLGKFCEVVRGARRPWISPGECLRTVAAVDAAYRSLRSGEWTEVSLFGRAGARIRAEA
jgi:predicted dehydrogenase